MRVAFLLWVLAVAGCVDPGEDYAAFGRRLGPGLSPTDGGQGGAAGDARACGAAQVTGDYVLALSVTIAPTKPIVARLALEGADEPPTVRFASIQPLSAADRETPVGDPFTAGPFDADGGRVSAAVPGLRVGGAANPITGGDIAADVTLAFDLCGTGEYLCGSVTGTVTEPLPVDLAGSTFALIPEGGALEPLSIDCAGHVADPL